MRNGSGHAAATSLLQGFEACWDDSPAPPDLAAFLAESGTLTIADLVALVLCDQRRRAALGISRPAEEYLNAVPLLRSDAEAAVTVVYNEFLLSEGCGAGEEELLRRFPEL